MPGKNENRSSEKGMSHAHGSRGSESVKSIEHVGSSGPHGIRFKVHNHPDKSEVHKELKE
jgi:hypothetical protein